MFDVISYDEHGNEDKAMAKKLKDGYAKVWNNMCKDCLGTGKREITFVDCFGNPVPEKTVYLKCNCKEVV
jgi:hypothetical protein